MTVMAIDLLVSFIAGFVFATRFGNLAYCFGEPISAVDKFTGDKLADSGADD